MSYLNFDKKQLVNLEYSLNKEILRSNRGGVYSATTLSGCNTRKYHGLMVVPLDNLDHGAHVLLSSLDVTVIQHEAEFNLGIHKFQGDKFEPKGHKYIRDFSIDLIPKTTYRVGGVVLTQEQLLVENEQQLLVKYTLEEAHSPTTLRFKPFLAFRNIHSLSNTNLDVDTHCHEINKGIKIKLYDGYPYLNMQFSKQPEFVAVPDWYYGIEYPKEQSRGYEYNEDLFVPGFFEVSIKKGESIVFSSSTSEQKPASFKRRFSTELNKRNPRDGFRECLENAAQQFVRRENGETNVIAGYPWYGCMPRHTFLSLPGIALSDFDESIGIDVIDTQLKYLKNGLFPKDISSGQLRYDAVDTPLLFFWALQHFKSAFANKKEIWKKYGHTMDQIMECYRRGTSYSIYADEDTLISGGNEDLALTWMDSNVLGKPLIPRNGKNVEVNALWYNAICFALELAEEADDQKFINKWGRWPDRVKRSFLDKFWDQEKGYLADTVNGDYKDWSVRPNMLFSTALEYSPLSKEQMKSILSVVKRELLTPRGIRTLSPRDPQFKGFCEGPVWDRENAVHNGSAWPWLSALFVKGYLKIHGRGGVSLVKEVINNFEEEMTQHSLGTLSELYDGNPPHLPRGAISMAINVSSVLSVLNDLEEIG